MTPAEVTEHAGISEGEATALLAMLAREASPDVRGRPSPLRREAG